MYGTREEPLFPEQQIQLLLGISKIHHIRDYEFGLDYIKAICSAKDGKIREQIMFTEQGLYNIILRSKTKTGNRFRKFIFELLKTIRLQSNLSIFDFLLKINETIDESQSEKCDLYILQIDNWYKIGRSKNISSRIKALQTGNQQQLKLHSTYQNKGTYERDVHDYAANIAVMRRSEWFQLDDIAPVIEYIEKR